MHLVLKKKIALKVTYRSFILFYSHKTEEKKMKEKYLIFDGIFNYYILYLKTEKYLGITHVW